MKLKLIFASLFLLKSNWTAAQMWEGTYQTQYGPVQAGL
ncbi:hypothetical protein Aconfl_02980 [Algoriphagus confluentis]|uniref:Uncharacterized protein n=1 Tax=Algoriphagus confluentis TaxID=1697556 RepID=A0ABQ6PII1_9BACT|nr:hypothetical protein Aconfl_02980 [Algoriphagus confluentis]